MLDHIHEQETLITERLCSALWHMLLKALVHGDAPTTAVKAMQIPAWFPSSLPFALKNDVVLYHHEIQCLLLSATQTVHKEQNAT